MIERNDRILIFKLHESFRSCNNDLSSTNNRNQFSNFLVFIFCISCHQSNDSSFTFQTISRRSCKAPRNETTYQEIYYFHGLKTFVSLWITAEILMKVFPFTLANFPIVRFVMVRKFLIKLCHSRHQRTSEKHLGINNKWLSLVKRQTRRVKGCFSPCMPLTK